MSFLFGLKNDSLADDAGIEPHKILGLLGAAGLVGKTYYVDSTHSRAGATQRHGTRTAPFSTLNWPITNLSAANLAKATFILLPGHTETLTTALGADCTIDAAGINIIGVGTGSYQPTIKQSTSTTSRVYVTGANCSISNVRFETAIDGTNANLLIAAADCHVDRCKFINGTAMKSVYFLQVFTGGSRAQITNCEFNANAASGTTAAIGLTTTITDEVRISDCRFSGYFGTSVIYSTLNLTNIAIERCTMSNITSLVTAGAAVLLGSTSTGVISHCLAYVTGALAIATEIFDGGNCAGFENYIIGSNNVGTKSAAVSPAVTT